MIEHVANQIAPDYAIWVVIAIKSAIVAGPFMILISIVAMYSIWWERKVAGHIQSRVGPMHVGVWHGWLQSLADGAKLILKEDLIPKGADSFLFRLAPYLAFTPVFAAYLVLPFGPQFIFDSSLSIGVLYILAVLAVEVMSTILAGWSSNSKWAIYGAMREACQMVSYEIPLGISIIIGVLVAGTLNLGELGFLQGGGIWDWFIFHNPFIWLTFLIYFIASLASNKRAPFDLPEAESELVAGYHTEYSGIRFSFFFFAEYAGMFVIGGIQAALFLGCWNSPLGQWDPIYNALGYDPIAAGLAYADGTLAAASTFPEQEAAMGMSAAGAGSGIKLFLLNVYCTFWFISKAMATIFVQIWIRWTLPRIRIDQVLHICVKILLPASLVMLFGAAIWVAVIPQPQLPHDYSSLPINFGHLRGDVGTVQGATQFILLGVTLLFLSLVMIVALKSWWGVIRGDETQPPKTLFPDVMPVSDSIAFTTGSSDKDP